MAWAGPAAARMLVCSWAGGGWSHPETTSGCILLPVAIYIYITLHNLQGASLRPFSPQTSELGLCGWEN